MLTWQRKKSEKDPAAREDLLRGGYCSSIKGNGPFIIGRDFDAPINRRPRPVQKEISADTLEKLWSIIAQQPTKESIKPKRVEFENDIKTVVNWYHSDCQFQPNIPEFRKQMKKLSAAVTQLESQLPNEETALAHFLMGTYTGDVMTPLLLKPSVTDQLLLEESWEKRIGIKVLKEILETTRRNIEGAQSLLGGKHKHQAAALVKSLGEVWRRATGKWPTSGRDPINHAQTGPFARLVRTINCTFTEPFRITKLDSTIRAVCGRKR
jgi:hypothetical protein